MKKVCITHSQYSFLFYCIIALILLFSDKGKITGDGILRWQALTSMMEEHHITPEKYSIIQPLFAAPLYWLADVSIKGLNIVSPQSTNPISTEQRLHAIEKVVQRFNKVIALSIVIWFYLSLQRVFHLTRKHATLATTFLLFGTLLIPHAKDFYSECLWTFLLLLSISLQSRLWHQSIAQVEKRYFFLLIGVGSLLIPLNPIFCIIFAGVLFISFFGERLSQRTISFSHSLKKPNIIALSVIICLGCFLTVLENYVRRGNPFNFGYTHEGFTTPLLYGLLGQIGSPTRGIVFFTPAFFVWFALRWLHWKKLHSEERVFLNLTLAYSLFLVIIYAKWHSWHGAWYWGPRFFLPLSIFGALYFSIILQRQWKSMRALEKSLIGILAIASFSIYKIGVTINQRHLISCLEQHPYSDVCFWKFDLLPYASFIHQADILKLLSHRSTLVEFVGLILVGVLLKGTVLSTNVSEM